MEKSKEELTEGGTQPLAVAPAAAQPAGKRGGLVVMWILSVLVAASLGVCVAVLLQSQDQNKKVNKFIKNQLERQAKEEEQNNTYQEDGFKVADTYEIRSTKAISDAYLSGDDSKLSDDDKETLKMAKKILEKVTKKKKDNYAKERAVYDWMVNNISNGDSTTIALPGTQVDNFTPHGVLKGRISVCVGYATTFRLFMNMMGLDCHIVHNDSHSWDLVQLDDKEWYHVDCYSGAGSKNHFYFNMTDARLQNESEWDTSALPAAKGIKYTVAVQEAKGIKKLSQLPGKVKKLLDKNQNEAFYAFGKKLSEKEIVRANEMVGQLTYATNLVYGDNIGMSAAWHFDEQENYVLGIYITHYEYGNTSSDIDPKDRKEIQKQVEAVFGVDMTEYLGTMDGEGEG